MEKIQVKIYSETGDIPIYATEGSVGCDIKSNEEFGLHPTRRHLFSTGIYLEIPDGYEMQIRPRSGNAIKLGLAIVNSPGSIDSDYRGEVKVILLNTGSEVIRIEKGMKIAQLVLKEALQADFIRVEQLTDLEKTDRGEGGFGHTDGK
jgi:dUTP pyrophosphatase